MSSIPSAEARKIGPGRATLALTPTAQEYLPWMRAAPAEAVVREVPFLRLRPDGSSWIRLSVLMPRRRFSASSISLLKRSKNWKSEAAKLSSSTGIAEDVFDSKEKVAMFEGLKEVHNSDLTPEQKLKTALTLECAMDVPSHVSSEGQKLFFMPEGTKIAPLCPVRKTNLKEMKNDVRCIMKKYKDYMMLFVRK